MTIARITTTRVLCAIALCAILSGCAKKHVYPGDRRSDDQVAYIEAERFLLAGVEFSIDGVAVGSLAQYYFPPGLPDEWLPGRPTKGASVLPGNHKLVAHIASYGWVTTAREGCASMNFQADPAQRYKLSVKQGALVMRNVQSGAEVAATRFDDCQRRSVSAR